MMRNKDSFEFKLNYPIKIHGVINGKNDFIEVSSIQCNAPSYELLNKTARKTVRNLMHKFRAAAQDFTIYRASQYEEQIIKTAEKLKNKASELEEQEISTKKKRKNNIEEEPEHSEEEMQNILFVTYAINSAPDDIFDYDKFTNLFKDFLANEVCYVEGQKSYLNASDLSNIDYVDFENLMFRYIGSFFFKSWSM
jgi:hypothetical protein